MYLFTAKKKVAQILLRRMAGGKTDHEIQGEAVRHENTNVFKYTEAICFPSIRHSDHEPQTAKLKLFLNLVSLYWTLRRMRKGRSGLDATINQRHKIVFTV